MPGYFNCPYYPAQDDPAAYPSKQDVEVEKKIADIERQLAERSRDLHEKCHKELMLKNIELIEKLRLAEAVVQTAEYTILAMEWESGDLVNAVKTYRAAMRGDLENL